MLTKYYIEIDGTRHEIPQRCIKNWDEVRCVYKRTDYSGVTRSFTSQFEFVGDMYDKLMALYLRDGVKAQATLSLFTITDNWEYVEQFSSDLDFSSVIWDNYVFKVNCIDDSLASMIKARKGTKYEFIVGQDIPVKGSLIFDRITMRNSCVHEIMGSGIDEWYGDHVDLRPSKLMRLPTNIVGNGETYENSPILFTDQTDSNGASFIEVVNSVNGLEIELEISTMGHTGLSDVVLAANIYLMSYNKSNPAYNSDTYTQIGQVFSYNSSSPSNRQYLGLYPTFEALKRKYPNPPKNVWALVGSDWATADEAYITPIGNIDKVEWIATTPWTKYSYRRGPVSAKGCSLFVYRNKFTINNATKNTCFALFYECSIFNPSEGGSQSNFLAIKSKIQTRWLSKAKSISIDSLVPSDVCKALVDRLTDGQINVEVDIDDSDGRVAKTYLFAAESIRNIPGAKLYTSFNDFCDWMETVYGYTYFIGPRIKPLFKRTQEYSLELILSASEHLLHTPCPGGFGHQVVLIKGTPYFAVLGDDYNDDQSLNFYTKWTGSELYNDPSTGKARTDTIFYDEYSQGIYFDTESNKHHFSGDILSGLIDSQSIHFVPRRKIFSGENIVKIDNARDVHYSVNSALAYSKITIGYEKQEYEAECGRDEWNFSAQYNTGVDKLDKNLSLISKYRADSYGFEFLSQERAKDTTDNKSDNSVFFAYCAIKTEEDETYDEATSSRGDGESGEIKETITINIDRTGCEISGALTNDVFNGQFSPIRCIQANAGYISAAFCPTILKFASFDGNTDVCIDGVSGNSNIELTEQLFSLGELSFTSSDVDSDIDVNALYEVESNGVLYRGFIKEVSFHYATNEAVKYTLIVKDIEL